MTALLFVPAFCIVALLAYMGRFSGRLRADEVRVLAVPLETLRAQLLDFARWQAWNPWLEHARAAPVLLSGTAGQPGHALAWEQGAAGVGRLTLTRLRKGDGVDMSLACLQPFKFRARTRWQLEAVPGGTRVHWSLRGRVGFSMRAFAKTVQGMLALDLRHGLSRLAAQLEHRPEQAYTISYLGVRELPAQRCACRPYRGPLADLPAAVPGVVAALRAELQAAGQPGDGQALAVYLRTQIKQRRTDCRIGVPGEAVGDQLQHEIPAHRAYVLRLQGPLAALETAWYQGMQRLRIEALEPDLRIPPFERYLRAPLDPASAHNEVELYLPLRAVPSDKSV